MRSPKCALRELRIGILEVSGNLACGALDGRPLAKAVAVVPGILQSQNWTKLVQGVPKWLDADLEEKANDSSFCEHEH